MGFFSVFGETLQDFGQIPRMLPGGNRSDEMLGKGLGIIVQRPRQAIAFGHPSADRDQQITMRRFLHLPRSRAQGLLQRQTGLQQRGDLPRDQRQFGHAQTHRAAQTQTARAFLHRRHDLDGSQIHRAQLVAHMARRIAFKHPLAIMPCLVQRLPCKRRHQFIPTTRNTSSREVTPVATKCMPDRSRGGACSRA